MADSFNLKALLSIKDNMSPALKQLATQAKATRKYLTDLGTAAKAVSGSIGLPVAALSGLLTGFGFGAVKKAMDSYAQTGEDIYKGSLRAGLAVEQYQRLKYVFEQSGVEAGAMEMAMGRLNKGIGAAASGKGKDLVGLLQKLRIPLRGANGELRNAADMLPVIADAFVRNENPVVRARMGFALFGKQWAEVVPLLTEGSKGIDALTARFARLKGVMSADDAKGAKDWGDLMQDLGVVTKGFQNTVAKELVPVLSPVVDDLIKWATANKKLVAAEVKGFVKDLVASLSSFDWAGLVQGVRDFGAGLKSMVDMVGGARNALIALVVVMNANALVSLLQLGGAVVRMTAFFGGLALSATAPILPLQALSASMVSANLASAGFLATLGKVGAAIAVVGAAAAGFQIGSLLNDNVINPLVERLTGRKGETLGGWLYDVMNPSPSGNVSVSDRPALPVGAGVAQTNSKVVVEFKDAPPGMRVVQTSADKGVTINPDVGYRTLGGALGTGTF